MTDHAFGVETVELDLPPLVAAFCARLHDAGVPATPARTAELARALTLVRPVSRRRLYWTARSVLVSDQSQVAPFDRVFRAVFGGTDRSEPFRPDQIQATAAPTEEETATDRRLEEAEVVGRDEPQPGVWSASAPLEASEDGQPVEVPVALASEEERLATRSFDALQPYELLQLQRLMSNLRLATPVRRTRRHRMSRRGRRIDMRRTLRASLRTGGDPIRLAHRQRREAPRRLVMLCDISGSMEPYARAYLQFLSCGAGAGPDAEAFVFATRLTRVTRALAARNPQRAMQRAAESAPDWSSGTRIGEALKRFNDRHGRRGMARGAVVVVLSDGWERGDPLLVGREMERLSRLAHRIVWVNPRISAEKFAVRAGGMVAALPHCDALVSGHSFAALGEVVAAIGGQGDRMPAAPAEPAHQSEPDPWASATPVPGSSVAMPSGYGPSKGKTTPGWVTDE